MEKEKFLKGMTYLGIAYNKEFTQEAINIWYDFFKDTDYEIFRQAVKRIIPKNKYLPSIAELRAEIAKITNPVLQLNTDEEWDKVITAIRLYGTYISQEEFNKFNPTTAKIIRTIGWRKMCMSENIEFERKAFYDMFNSYQKRNEDASIINSSMLTENERLMLNESSMSVM